MLIISQKHINKYISIEIGYSIAWYNGIEYKTTTNRSEYKYRYKYKYN